MGYPYYPDKAVWVVYYIKSIYKTTSYENSCSLPTLPTVVNLGSVVTC